MEQDSRRATALAERLALKISGAGPKNKVDQSAEGARDEGEKQRGFHSWEQAGRRRGEEKRSVAFVRPDVKSSGLRHEKWLLGVKWLLGGVPFTLKRPKQNLLAWVGHEHYNPAGIRFRNYGSLKYTDEFQDFNI